MTPALTATHPLLITRVMRSYAYLLWSFFAGLLIPFGFAPFHQSGLSIIGMALLFILLQKPSAQASFYSGMAFGLGYFGLGISWIYVSIHNYGHLNFLLSALGTLLFITYLALFPGCVALLYQRLAKKHSLLTSCFLFSALWCLGEWLRATAFTGFPWLLLGFGQMDTPLKYLLPIVGVYGVSFITCFIATCLAISIQTNQTRRYIWMSVCVGLILIPALLHQHNWTTIKPTPLSVGIIQANLSMRDKWDETLFWQIIQRYQTAVNTLAGKTELIVMPESAIPVPENYVNDVLDNMEKQVIQAGSAVVLGIPKPTNVDDTAYYNTMTTLGEAHGSYSKQHLVPFGEFIPKPFQKLANELGIPVANMRAGGGAQALLQIQHHPVASLICYELAYPDLLRKQLPEAEWIMSISDDGWFGHSLALYQHVQMAQVISLQTGRYQIMANNDGLSSVINSYGDIVASLPAFHSGILETSIKSTEGITPWVYWGDDPILVLCAFMLLIVGLKTQVHRRTLSKNVLLT
jgi:apolipoprotein N-acyltransferase